MIINPLAVTYVEQHLLQQVERASLPRGQCTTYKLWTTLMREMYELCLTEGTSLAEGTEI